MAVKGEQVTLQFIYNDGKLKDAFVAKVREHLKQLVTNLNLNILKRQGDSLLLFPAVQEFQLQF